MTTIQTPEVTPLGGFSIASSDSSTMINSIKTRMQHGQTALFFANTNFVVKCQHLKQVMNKPDTLIINDGIGLNIASWMVHRHTFIENLNGSDFLPQLFQGMKTDARVFLVGAKPGIAARAAANLKKNYQVEVVGARNGYDDMKDSKKLIQDINESNANIVLVAMGNPSQEQWIIDHRQDISASLLMGVGAFLDFMAGDKPRAPEFIRRMRLEWFYRLCLEPSRLLKRYTIDIAVFLRLCLRQGKSLG